MRDFAFTRFGAVAVLGFLTVLADALARRAVSFLLALLPDFAFADLAALLFATDRDARDAAASGLRLRTEFAAGDALLFFATVRDDFLLAFFRAAMSQALHAWGFRAGEIHSADNKSPDC